jgi:hypothetical protein
LPQFVENLRKATKFSVRISGLELYSLYKEPNIVEDIKFRRLGWAGHIVRIEEQRIPKKVLNGNFHTVRPVGRPRTRWTDVVQRDARQLLGIRG